MAYTDNVPQANQQIAATQPLIQANFGFLETGIGTEHNFNDSGSGSDMYHLQASMPNQSDPGSLPAGTNGLYYVSGGLPKYYNGTAYFLQTGALAQTVLTGTVALTTSAANVVTIPANSVGQYYLLPPTGIGGVAYAVGLFITSTSTLQLPFASDADPNITLNTSGRILQAQTTSSSYNGTYKYVVVYYTP
jgi:hypothetical protein